MEPKIISLSSRKFIGQKLIMSLANNKTPELWQKFMPRRKEISADIKSGFYAIQVYAETTNFKNFDTTTKFEQWAAVEVDRFDVIPKGMEAFSLPKGLYAVFIHTGLESTFPETSRYIFEDWLPKSDFALDSRPHFELMGDRYMRNDPKSEEEVWIPVVRNS